MDKITVKAPAKINLTLDVLGRRENGYHDLRMIMQTIDLCDEVTIEQITAEEITLSMNMSSLMAALCRKILCTAQQFL